MSAIGQVLHGGRVGLADLELMRDKLYYDRRDQRDALVKFGVLLGLSLAEAFPVRLGIMSKAERGVRLSSGDAAGAVP